MHGSLKWYTSILAKAVGKYIMHFIKYILQAEMKLIFVQL